MVHSVIKLAEVPGLYPNYLHFWASLLVDHGSSMAHLAKLYGRLGWFVVFWEHILSCWNWLKFFPCFFFFFFFFFYIILICFNLFIGLILASKTFVRLVITSKGLIPKTCVWFVSQIPSDLKWCIYLGSKSFFCIAAEQSRRELMLTVRTIMKNNRVVNSVIQCILLTQ